MATKGRPFGGTKFTNAKLSANSKKKINPDAKITKIEATPDDDREYYCTCCGKKYKHQKNNFSVTSSPLFAGNNGYVSICKSCVDKYYLQLVDYYSGNEEHAIERCCQLFDWYYSDDVAAMTQKSMSAGKTRIGLYPSKMNVVQNKKTSTYLDTVMEKSKDTIDSIADLQDSTINPEDGELQVSTEDVEMFGAGYKPDEYHFLREQYDEWITRYEAKTKAQEELFKVICIAQLSIRRAQQQNNSKGVAEATKSFQDLLGSANLKPSQNNDNSLVEQNTFGTLIKKWEDENPIPEAEYEFKDVDNIKKYIDVFFYGHLAKTMNIENDYSKLYDEEMGKYTVEQPRYEDDSVSDEEGADDGDNTEA